MKRPAALSRTLALLAFSGALAAQAEDPIWKSGSVRACWFRANITCKVGDLLSGYGQNDVSVEKLDDLEACGLCLDDGERKAMIVSFDLLGMNRGLASVIRRELANIIGTTEERVLLSCTHTHGGPNTRSGIVRDSTTVRRTPPNEPYLNGMTNAVYAKAREMIAKNDWKTCRVGFYSSQVDENRNRRSPPPDNCTAAAEYRRVLLDINKAIADKELGLVVLIDGDTLRPRYLIGNYAAHALASHAPGRGGYRITADYPGVFRRHILQEMGCEAMFITGASGDVVPKENEVGVEGARRTGINLAKAAMGDFLDVQRGDQRFLLKEPKLGACFTSLDVPLNARFAKLYGKANQIVEFQCLAVGDVAIVGVPGELTSALGLEIKWHSPFMRTFVAYNSTDYLSYVLPLHETCSGGYEPQLQRIRSRYSLNAVLAVQGALIDLRERLFPTPADAVDPYPDYIDPPLFNLPGGYKPSKWSSFQK